MILGGVFLSYIFWGPWTSITAVLEPTPEHLSSLINATIYSATFAEKKSHFLQIAYLEIDTLFCFSNTALCSVKNVLLNSYSSMKKNQKDSNDFWHRKLTLKVRFRHFLTTPVNICESQINFFIFILLIFLLKSSPCWLTSAKLHHWGHTMIFTPNVKTQ